MCPDSEGAVLMRLFSVLSGVWCCGSACVCAVGCSRCGNLGGVSFFGGPRVRCRAHHILLFRLEGVRPFGVRRLCGAWPCWAVLIWLVLASGSWMIGARTGRIFSSLGAWWLQQVFLVVRECKPVRAHGLKFPRERRV